MICLDGVPVIGNYYFFDDLLFIVITYNSQVPGKRNLDFWMLKAKTWIFQCARWGANKQTLHLGTRPRPRVFYGLFSRKVCYQRHPKKRSQWEGYSIFTNPMLFHLDPDLFQDAWIPNFHIINYHTLPAFAGTLKPIDACTSPCNCCKCELADLISLKRNPCWDTGLPDTKTCGL